MSRDRQTDDYQKSHYDKVWSELELSDAPGKSGWKTTVPAPDFAQFIDYLAQNHITGPVLDLGCGGGRHAIALAKHGFQTYGIDFAEAAIRQAQSNARAAGVGEATQFITGNALDLPYPDHTFGAVNDDGCLHHIDPAQWSEYLQNVTRVLRPEGTLRLKVFSRDCDYFRRNAPDVATQWVNLTSSGYTYFFTEADLHRIFDQDFEFIECRQSAHTQTDTKNFFFVMLKAR